MNKIPTLFVRDFGPGGRGRYVTSELTPGCGWVLAGEGVPTRKFDGTCMMFDGDRWWSSAARSRLARRPQPGSCPWATTR